MKTYYFERCWETVYSCYVEAESLEEAIKKVQDDEEGDWDCDHGNDVCISTKCIENVDEENETEYALDYDFNILEDE